ncbi:hypothetical protein D3C76_645760 [compost metagenome]
MKEIPLLLIKVNQASIVIFVLLSFIFQQPLFIYFVFLIQLVALLFGAKTNLFILLAKLFINKEKLQKSETQAAELAHFNQTIAVTLLGISSVSYLFGWNVIAYIASAMVAVAAFVAVLGYCVGCTLYYQYKRWKLLRSRANS